MFDKYLLEDEDIALLVDMIENGNEPDALDIFTNAHVILPSQEYQDMMTRYLGYSDGGPISRSDQSRLIRNIAVLTVGFSALLIKNFKTYINDIYSPSVFKVAGLKDSDIKKAILNQVISEYEQFIGGSMSQTENFIVGSIRTLQREMITENVMIKKLNLSGENLNLEITRFKESLRSKYPEIYKGIEDGQILVVRKVGLEGETVRHYKLDYYTDMTTRTTLLNIDRTSNETMARVNSERVVEYYLSDPRSVKKDREICQDILNTKILGKSLLALDDIAASALNILTIDEAKESPDYAMGPYCRHTFRRLLPEFLKLIDSMIETAMQGA